MTKLHTHYDNLKVARDAPSEVIRAAYRALSQKHHPDRHPDDSRASKVMSVINASYDVLSVSEKRREHDLWIAHHEQQANGVKPRQVIPTPETGRSSSFFRDIQDYLLSFPVAWSMVVAPRSKTERFTIGRRLRGMLVLASYFVWAIVIFVVMLLVFNTNHAPA